MRLVLQMWRVVCSEVGILSRGCRDHGVSNTAKTSVCAYIRVVSDSSINTLTE